MNRFIEKIRSDKAALWVCLALALMVWAVFGQTLRHEFVYDSIAYVCENPDISQGLNPSGVAQAFRGTYVANWHPITMLSYLLDYELYGLNPAGYHGTNVFLHAVTAIALFLVLRAMTGSLWCSAFVAAVFAIHPLRVESVAWVAERKDVLSGLFFMLTLGAYFHYVRRPFSAGRYALVALFFTLGLMSKPMLVTLPFVLFLLDFWPLDRLGPVGVKKLILEKVPLFLLVAAFCAVTIWAQQTALMPNEKIALPWRIGNAVVSYAVYIKQMVFPSGLAVLYPHRGADIHLWQIAISLVVLASISLAVLAGGRKRPYLPIGWLWYLGMLVPVIGILQVGGQAHADRYTYLPQIGLSLLLTWGVTDLTAGWRHRRLILGAAAVLILTGLGTAAWVQTSHWKNSNSLWVHTLKHTENNPVAHNNLGLALTSQGKSADAIEQYRSALRINPNHASAHNNLGLVLASQGKFSEAIEQYRSALRINPDYLVARNNLGSALASQGKSAEAIEQYRSALRINPDYPATRNNLGNALASQGKNAEAIEQYRSALLINPDAAIARNNLGEAHNNLGNALASQGKISEAIEQYRNALRINPHLAKAHINLGLALASQGKSAEAIEQYRSALRIDPNLATVRIKLGLELASQGKIDEAIEQYRSALRINPYDATTHCKTGHLLCRRKDFGAAIEQYEQAIRLYQNYPEAKNNLAWLLATCPDASLRDGHRAVELALSTEQLSGSGNASVLDTLAAAYAEAGRYPEAVKTARRALELAGSGPIADDIRKHLELYQTGQPFHEPKEENP